MVKQQLEKYQKPKIGFQVLGIILASIFIILSAGLIWFAACDTEQGEIPDVFGWSACSSNGGYNGIPRDALILVRLSQEGQSYEQGKVVAFYYPNAPTSTKIYLGSISSIEEGKATLYLNEETPELCVDQGLILGRAEYYIEDAGYFLAILEGGYGLILAISILVLFLAILIMFIGNIALRRQRALEAAELEKELDIQEEILEQKRQETAQLDTPLQGESQDDSDSLQEDEAELAEIDAQGVCEEAPAEEQTAEKTPKMQISGAADSELAHICIQAEQQQAELLQKLIQTMQQKKELEMKVQLAFGEPCTLEIECTWKDVPVVSAILVELQKRGEVR